MSERHEKIKARIKDAYQNGVMEGYTKGLEKGFEQGSTAPYIIEMSGIEGPKINITEKTEQVEGLECMAKVLQIGNSLPTFGGICLHEQDNENIFMIGTVSKNEKDPPLGEKRQAAFEKMQEWARHLLKKIELEEKNKKRSAFERLRNFLIKGTKE